MDDDQEFCLRWNKHQSTLVSVFDTLLEKGIHVDCTLAAEGQTLRAHKVVLSACSPYFESVLCQQYDKHPIIILKDVNYAELRAMMDYMYRGESSLHIKKLSLPNSNVTIYCDVSTPSPRPFVTKPLRKQLFDSLHNLSHPGANVTARLVAERLTPRVTGSWNASTGS
ncbi:unnamed protein product [Euphydryas editha]|uniref:BTB domain-containing protein n=1 Tax=Euphydryas editha TaxID=104508 RepID=A0AAU9THY0_EUPED|nr:unnamed protein product [Euphydryas editha]